MRNTNSMAQVRTGVEATVDVPELARSQQNILMVRQSLLQSGHMSSRQNAFQLSRISFQRITSEEIRFNPYRLIRRQELNQGDPPRILAFCNWLVNITQNDPAFLDHLITSDEAVFSLSSEVNTHNVICYVPYSYGPPQGHDLERQQGTQSVFVWVGVTTKWNYPLTPFCATQENIHALSAITLFKEILELIASTEI